MKLLVALLVPALSQAAIWPDAIGPYHRAATMPAGRGFSPSMNLVPNIERSAIGPASLQKFAPAIPPPVPAFHFGAEGQTGVFHSPKGEMALAVFSYPTPQIARLTEEQFRKI